MKTMHCHKCNTEIEIFTTNFPGRHDDCSSCGSSLRCCLNCEFFERSMANQCREPGTERVSEKDQANYCDFFKVADRTGGKFKKVDFKELSSQFAKAFQKNSK